MPTGLLQTLQRVGELCYSGKKKELQAVAATVSWLLLQALWDATTRQLQTKAKVKKTGRSKVGEGHAINTDR